MARRYAPLSPRQVEVLRWVADGCPDGVWPDTRYKVTAYALAGRGLVKVSRRRDSWQASITVHGGHYLEHGSYQLAGAPGTGRTRPEPPAEPAVVSSPAPASLVTAESLLDELGGSGAALTVPDPPVPVRAAYRRVISRASTDGLVPDGCALRHTGRDRGDLVIRLARLEGEKAQPGPLPAVPVPETLEGCHDAVAALRGRADLLDVCGEARQRALLIALAIAGECSRRGYQFGLRDDGQPSFQITAGEDRFCFTLSEELERREVADPGKLAAAKYPWQRIPSAVRQVPSGRLALRLDSGSGSAFWADRKRWSLAQKLPEVFREVAVRASAQAEERSRKEKERRQRRQAWEEAIPRARQAHIDQLNRDRLHDQAARSAQAEAIRGYCARLESLAQECGDPGRADQIRAWAAWARREAGQTDPASHPDQLAYLVPAEVSPSDLEKFMPRGLTAWHPPG